jgi:hypothetical protein
MENEYQSYLQRKRKAPTTGFLTAAANLAKKLKNAPLAPVLRNQIKSDLVNVPWKSEVEKWIEQHNIQDVTRFCIVGSKKSAKLPEEFPAAISEYLKNAIGVLEEFDFAEFIRSLGSSSTQELKNLIKSLRSKLSTRCDLVEPFSPDCDSTFRLNQKIVLYSPVVTRTKSDKLPEPSLFSRPNSLELPKCVCSRLHYGDMKLSDRFVAVGILLQFVELYVPCAVRTQNDSVDGSLYQGRT